MEEANGAVEEREKEKEDEPVIEPVMEEIENKDPLEEFSRIEHNCPDGRVWVKPFKKSDGTYVKGFCRKRLNAMHEKFREFF